MIKRMALFLFAVALTSAAVTSTSEAALKPTCNAPACYRTPGCCVNLDCDSFCGGPGTGVCMGECCECNAAS